MHERKHPVRRRLAIAAAVVGALIVAIALAGLPVYVFPPVEPIGEADLIYVIGPPTQTRIALEEELRRGGVADAALISVPLEGAQSAADSRVCFNLAVACEHPEPFTTKGEASMLAAYARDHGVQRTIVITYTPHVARTRYIFAKCYSGDVTVVAVDEHLDLIEWVKQYIYQSIAFVKAWATPCSDLEE